MNDIIHVKCLECMAHSKHLMIAVIITTVATAFDQGSALEENIHPSKLKQKWILL